MFDLEKIKSSDGRDLFPAGIYYLPEIDSTNKYAKSLTDKSDALVLTDYQSQGLGRMGRTWASEKGKNLTFTLIKHFDIESENIQAVNFFFSYFLHACLKDFCTKKLIQKNKSVNIATKWPNDILAGSKKLCGLLIENESKDNRFIIGIGINVNQESFPEKFINNAVSLKNIIGEDIDLNKLLIELLNVYAKNINLILSKKYEIIYRLWKNSSCLVGKVVEFRLNGSEIKTGKIIDLMYNGGLKMQVNEEIKTFYSGDIKLSTENPGLLKE